MCISLLFAKGRGGGVAVLVPRSDAREWSSARSSWHAITTCKELVPGRALMVRVSVAVRRP
eukprot:6617129-Pyramimonas_sp.AAC.1